MATLRWTWVATGLAGAAALVAAPAAATPTDLLDASKGTVFNDGLVWSLSAGGIGLAAGLGLLYFLGVGGLRHVDRENVLEHPLRTALLDTVQGTPGIHLRELAQRHDTAVTNTQWHLRKLEMAGLVRTQKVQGKRVYYPAQGGAAVRERAVENAVRANPNADRLSSYLAVHGGAHAKALSEQLHMNPGTVRWHLRKLEEAGIVRSIPEGGQVRYFLMKAPTGRPERPLAAPMVEVGPSTRS